MKLKKLFAGVVAVAMMATMAMPSFAAKHTYNEGALEDHDSITVTKVYSLVGTGSSPDETFTLEQVGDGVVKKGGATTAPALGTILVLTLKLVMQLPMAQARILPSRFLITLLPLVFMSIR